MITFEQARGFALAELGSQYEEPVTASWGWETPDVYIVIVGSAYRVYGDDKPTLDAPIVTVTKTTGEVEEQDRDSVPQPWTPVGTGNPDDDYE